jgi:hypothetical protein
MLQRKSLHCQYHSYNTYRLSILAIRRSKSAIIIRLLGSALTVHNSQLNPIDKSIQFNPTSDTSCHVLEWLSAGFWIGYWTCWSLYYKLVITFNYSVTANFHTLQITTAYTKSYPDCSVFTGSCLVMACNNGYCSASGLKSSLNTDSLPTL